MGKDEGEEKKRMRQDDGEEVKCAGGYAESVKGDDKKPIAMELHDAMMKCWQIQTNWPDPEAVLQTIGPDTREQAVALQTTLGTVLARLQEFPEKPAIFLAYMDWAKSLHISLTDHKDVQILAATFCSCTRGLWMQRERAMWAHTITIICDVVLAAGYAASRWPKVGMEITIMLDQRVDATMGQYTQQYREATAGMPAVYQTIICID